MPTPPKLEYLEQISEDDDTGDFDEELFDLRRIQPSDLAIPSYLSSSVYATLFEVPEPIGKLIGEVITYGIAYSLREQIDEWTAMPFHAEFKPVGAYLEETGWYNGSITAVTPPREAGLYICLTEKGLRDLVSFFPSENYKQKQLELKRLGI